MCGIAGIFHRRGQRPDAAVLDAMTDRLAHRGPDGRGTHVHDGVGLGHRRLSIIGLSDGAQPMTNEDRTIWVTYNGEIYNYQSLRAELEALGHTFATHSDTEVIVHGYEAWDVGVVERLRGIFAFALLDERRTRMLCARDRLGVKPFYYHLTPELFLFGSEPKALLVHPQMPRRPNLDAIWLALRYGYVPAPYAAFEGMQQLEPGSMLVVTERASSARRYWTPPFMQTGVAPDPDVELDDLIDRCVDIELMSEVPLGAFLSGGVDSSIVAAAMARSVALDARPRTFCIGFPEADFDESPHSRAVAGHLGLDHTVEMVSIDELDLLDRLVEVYDEPFFDASAIPTYALSKMTRRHVTVALSGDGGDELFAGYRRYGKIAGCRALPTPARWALGAVAKRVPNVRGKDSVHRLTGDLAAQYDYLTSVPEWRVRAFSEAPLHREVDWSLRKLFERAPGEDVVAKAQWCDLMSYLPGDILTKVDRASMANSLEVRVPLLDHELVEWAARLPPEHTFGGGALKVALKAHLGRRVPPSIIDRPKMGFGVPLGYWIGGDNGLVDRSRKLRQRNPKNRFYAPIKPEAVEDLERRHGRTDLSHQIWALVFLEAWWQKHFV